MMIHYICEFKMVFLNNTLRWLNFQNITGKPLWFISNELPLWCTAFYPGFSPCETDFVTFHFLQHVILSAAGAPIYEYSRLSFRVISLIYCLLRCYILDLWPYMQCRLWVPSRGPQVQSDIGWPCPYLPCLLTLLSHSYFLATDHTLFIMAGIRRNSEKALTCLNSHGSDLGDCSEFMFVLCCELCNYCSQISMMPCYALADTTHLPIFYIPRILQDKISMFNDD